MTGLLSVPATVAGVSVTEHQRRQKLNDKISRQQGQLQGLVQLEQKFNLEKNINNLAKQKQTLAEQLNSQQHSLERLQQQKLDLENAIATISSRKQELEIQLQERQQQLIAGINSLQNKSKSLRQQKREVEQSLAEIKTERQQEIAKLIEQQQKCALLQEEINRKKTHKRDLDLELLKLDIKQHDLQAFTFKFNTEIERLQQQEIEFNKT